MEQQHLISALDKMDGTIVHLGAGECRELQTYLETAAEQIVLVEPDPEVAESLRQRTHKEPRVTVIEVAVAAKEGEATLYGYNASGQATLHALKKPPVRWPGLRQIAKSPVKTLSLAQLLAQITLAEDKQHWLVVETPGEEQQVLCAMREYALSQRFGYLSLAIGSLIPQMEQARLTLLQTLDEIGYRLEHVMTQPDQLVYYATNGGREAPGRDKQRLEKLQTSNSELQQENRQLKAESEEIHQRQEQLEEELRKAEVQVELIKAIFLSEAEAQE